MDIINDSNELEGTSVFAIKEHLNKIGYKPQGDQSNEQQLMRLQQFQQQQHQPQQHQQQQQQQQHQSNQSGYDMFRNEIPNDHPLYGSKKNNKKLANEKPRKKKGKDIVNLVSDINKSLENFTPSKSNNEEKEESTEEEPIYDHDHDNEDEGVSGISMLTIDALIICVLYIILSQNSVRIFLGKFIKQVNVRADGTVSILGIIIYGILLAVLFVLCRMLI
jgi:hypothetical protein